MIPSFNGARTFVVGDRIVFLENDAKLNVKNGMLGMVEEIGQGRLVARLDRKETSLVVDTTAYKSINYGYACEFACNTDPLEGRFSEILETILSGNGCLSKNQG